MANRLHLCSRQSRHVCLNPFCAGGKCCLIVAALWFDFGSIMVSRNSDHVWSVPFRDPSNSVPMASLPGLALRLMAMNLAVNSTPGGEKKKTCSKQLGLWRIFRSYSIGAGITSTHVLKTLIFHERWNSSAFIHSSTWNRFLFGTLKRFKS